MHSCHDGLLWVRPMELPTVAATAVQADVAQVRRESESEGPHGFGGALGVLSFAVFVLPVPT